MSAPPSPVVALVTDLWPSASAPHSGRFIYDQVASLGDRFRHVVLFPHLIAASAHRRVWGGAVQGWQRGLVAPRPPHRLLRYPSLRVPKVGEAAVRGWGARLALAAAWERPALVHGHFLLHVGPAAVRLARALGVPSVVTVHGTDFAWLVRGGIQLRLREEMLRTCRSADCVIAVAETMRDELTRRGVPAEQIAVIPMGVDADVFVPRDRAAARRELEVDLEIGIVLFVGRATEDKGIRVLEQAVELLDRSDVACYVAGPASGDLGLAHVGVLPPERLATWMAAANVVCLPSFSEGSPVSVVEALACGVPVVASAVGGVPAQIEHGVNGLLVEPGDATALAGALGTALGRAWSSEAIRASSRPFWLSETGARLAALYESLIE